MRNALAGIVWLAASLTAVAAEPDRASPRVDSPYLRPELRPLMEAATFHLSFDRGVLWPDMAEGPRLAPAASAGEGPQFAPGLRGQALVLGSGAAVYPRAGNVTLERRGSLALWIKPEGWLRPRDRNTVFAMTTNATFYLERQGPDRDADDRVTRHEGILYLVFPPGQRSANLNGGADWANGRWRLLVANWAWPACELSVDGGPFQVAALAAPPDGKIFGELVVGDGGGRHGLIDEVWAFRRPLTQPEAKRLYDALRE